MYRRFSFLFPLIKRKGKTHHLFSWVYIFLPLFFHEGVLLFSEDDAVVATAASTTALLIKDAYASKLY